MAFRATRSLTLRGRAGVGAVGTGMVLGRGPSELQPANALPPSPQAAGLHDVESLKPSPSGGGWGGGGGDWRTAHSIRPPPGPLPKGGGLTDAPGGRIVEREGASKDSPAGRTGCSGFTLVELMVVVVLLGIAMGIVIPRISRIMFASDIKLATRQLAALVQVTRDRAVRSHRPQYRLNYDLKEGELWITYISPSGEVVEDERTLVRRRHWPGQIRLVDVITQFQGRREKDQDLFTVFLPSGYIERTLLHLTDGEVEFTLVIDSLTGRIRRHDGFIEEIAVGTVG